MPIKTYQLTLKWAEKITKSVRHLAFSSNDPALFEYEPGQFITIHFARADKNLKRSYSIATIPGQSDCIEIAAGYVEGGPGTELLFGLEPGDAINAMGPFGRLVLRPEEHPKRYILMATSTGVTPYRAMLPELAKRMAEDGTQVVVLEGVQTRADLLYGEEFAAFAAEHPNFEFRAHYSRESSQDLKPYEHLGYVQTAFEALSPNPETDLVYLCGNPGMVDASYNDLIARGFDIKNVRREKYISN